MNKLLTSAIALAMCTPAAAMAAPTLYGKANLSYASLSADDLNDPDTSISTVRLESHASRIGIKGSEEISEGFSAIYKAEFQVQFDDGQDKTKTFVKRNIYAGVKGNFGSVIAGHFDTPFKKAQNKVDLFNDLYGDIKVNFTNSDKRASNSVMYSSPEVSGFTLYADFITSEDKDASNGTSVALTYNHSHFYAALAYDLDVSTIYTFGSGDDQIVIGNGEGTSALRGVFQYNRNTMQFGLLAEEFEDAEGEKNNGVFASFKYGIKQWDLKAQYGQSDIRRQDGETLSLGADYKFSKSTKVYGYYTNNTYIANLDTSKNIDSSFAGVGIEVKF